MGGTDILQIVIEKRSLLKLNCSYILPVEPAKLYLDLALRLTSSAIRLRRYRYCSKLRDFSLFAPASNCSQSISRFSGDLFKIFQTIMSQ